MPPASKLAPTYGGKPKFVHPINVRRALYNETIKMYTEDNTPDDVSIQPAYIRSEVVLSVAVATQTIVFNIRTDTPNGPGLGFRSSEKRLDDRDAFIADHATVMFGNELIASTNPGQLVLQQFPNPAAVAAFPAPGGFAANQPGIVEAYNGNLSWIINSVQYQDGIDMLNFLHAAQAQMGTLVFTASNTFWNDMGGYDGWVELTPAMNLWGSDKSQFTVTLPDPFLFNVASNRVVAVLMLRGLKVQGGAAVL